VSNSASSSRIMRRLTTLFPSEFLEEHAGELGVVEREGKLPVLVWALVFGFAAGESRTLAGFRRSYNSTADETISPGGFYHRLTPKLAEYLRDLVALACPVYARTWNIR
jgi:putative transposase